ncbi:uncharacterized protein BX664DRAFT_324588 [Halteromyces radiatus]|uniref:uncharacterized protein n=1 Tax=Halteromyces radiatus TaxID=101107 RepID=UPI00221FA184|nr:uncharacterized protein BX664DRAFT_324588 [Halteromyces radiatus]KAI8096677.1 hypothetical protein BX664DRAFT_324588 [Halteromyces radiatus]
MYQENNDDIEQPTSQENYERLNTFVRSLRRKQKNSLPNACCCCLDTRLGSRLACFIWAGLSLYFACLAFMNKSPFYSYFNRIPLTIFGILNLLFFFVNMAAIFIITWKAAPIVLGRLSQMIWGFVIAILVDMIANYIAFLARPGDFQTWCFNLSQSSIQQAFNQANQNTTITIPFDSTTDYYNCNRLYQDQVTWTLLSIVAMSFVYIHWAMVITSWERWYVIQPPRMAPFNEPKSNQPSVAPNLEQEHDQPEMTSTTLPSHHNASSFHSGSNLTGSAIPTAAQQQQQYYEDGRVEDPSMVDYYPSQRPMEYIPQDQQYHQSDPQFHHHHQPQQQQDQYMNHQHNPAQQYQQYQQPQQEQVYYAEDQYPSGRNDGYYRY